MQKASRIMLGVWVERAARCAAVAMCAGGVTSTAHGQWTIVQLHPSWAIDSEARSVWGGQQVGVANSGNSAMLWNGASSAAIRLNPLVDAPAVANGVIGGVEAGSVTLNSGTPSARSHGALWSGTAGSWIDIHPSNPAVIHSLVLNSAAGTQVGSYAVDSGATFTAGRACMWSGTAESWVDLNPVGFGTSEARGAFGNQQVGATFDSFLGQACMWYGSAESFVNLNPPEALFSVAACTDGAHQYGVIGVLDPVPGLFPARWSGTAESWELYDSPPDRWGEIHATDGGYQVGYITDTDGISNSRACIWTTGPGSYQDLQQYLPAPYTESNALGIWRHGTSGTTYIVGYALNSISGQREAIMWVNGAGVNLIASPAAPADCSAAAGQTLAYSVRVLNAGADSSGTVTLTVDLPPNSVATFASAVPSPTSISATQLVFSLPGVASSGGFTDVAIALNAVSAGATATITAHAAAAGEVDPTNNTASASARIEPAQPATAAARGIFSTNTALANSLMPGGSGGRFTAFNAPSASPSGNWWIVRARTNLAAAQDFAIVRTATGGSSGVLAQEGVTSMGNGLLEQIDSGAEVNDNGLVAFAGDDAGPAATDRFIATSDGTTVTTLAREGQAIPAMPGISYGSSVGASANILANGHVGFSTTSTPAGSTAYLSDNGNSLVARLNVTTPVGASAPIDTMIINTTGQWGLAFDASGTHSLYQADINTGAADNDQVIVADGTVVIQEGVTSIPGLASTVGGGNKFMNMGPSGTWMVRGTNLDPSEDWVVRGSGTSITQNFNVGDPIFTGAAETWIKDIAASTTFFAHTSDAAGNYIIGGYTNAESFANAVLVYDNSTVVARENDPVDLDGNGQFDDDVYIRSFDSDSVALVTGGLIATVTLRDADAALCHLNNTSVGAAVVFIPLSACAADFNGDHSVDFFDYLDFVDAFASNLPSADFNHDASIDFFDYLDFVDAFASGC